MPRIPLFVITLLFFGCADDKDVNEGYALAKKNCSVCHGFVDAKMLDKKTWNKSVLPQMAPNLGIGVFGESEYINNPHKKSAVSFQEWTSILHYYLQSAPDSLSPAIRPQIPDSSWAVFHVRYPQYRSASMVRTALTSFDTASGRLYTSDAYSNYLTSWNQDLQPLDSTRLNSAAVSAVFNRERVCLATLGSMTANDDQLGEVLSFNLKKPLDQTPDTIATKLRRPVNLVQSDSGFIVCAFGHNKGGLYIVNANMKPDTLLTLPGAIRAIPGDFNADQRQDFMVLFAHDDECIRLFTNNGDGSFSSKKLLSFPPVYGSTNFQIADFNDDGRADILYTCGDNADISKIFKPYHGVYLFLNKGNDVFEKSWFYPINGCTKAIAGDFDRDGDLDIATIALFADFRKRPEEAFLYFEQRSPLNFAVHAPPVGAFGRWITMEAADYDRDGDDDLVLGNFSTGFIIDRYLKPSWSKTIPFIILENKTR